MEVIMNQPISISPDGVKYPLPKEEDYKKEIARIEKAGGPGPEKEAGDCCRHGRRLRGLCHGGHRCRHHQYKRQVRQIRDRYAATEHKKLLEDTQTQRGRLAGQGGGSGSGPHDPALRFRQEDPGGDFRLRCSKACRRVVVDVQLDYAKNELGNVRNGQVEMNALEESFDIIAHRIPSHCLVLIETTVAPGTTEQVALPAMRKVFRQRGIKSDPLIAHSYERVMPGRDYVASIRDFWRVCSGVNEEAKQRVVKFLK